jgi:enolase 1/2/3
VYNGLIELDLLLESVHAREILDGRGWPTVEVEIRTGGRIVRGQVPTGLSRGSHEAYELRDGGKRYGARGVKRAVANVNEVIAPRIVGRDFSSQHELDKELIAIDGTPNKRRLGANAILGVSLSAAKMGAELIGVPLYKYLAKGVAEILPTPFFDVIGGGKLVGIPMEIQECIFAPTGFKSYSEAMQASVEIYFELGEVLEKKFGKSSLNVGVDGGYTPQIKTAEEGLSLIQRAVERTGHDKKIDYALDAAATQFYNSRSKTYRLHRKVMNREKMLNYYERLTRRFHLISIEDPLYQDDWQGFRECRERLKIQIVGDDLFATNLMRLKMGIKKRAGNAMLLKINQIGTLTEALEAGRYAMENGYGVMVSERSGEPEDDSIADIAVALNCGQIKTGAPSRAEHTAKYNRLFRIEEQLGADARYAGRRTLSKLR